MTRFTVEFRDYGAPYELGDERTRVQASVQYPGYGPVIGYGVDRDAALEDLRNRLFYAKARAQETVYQAALRQSAVKSIEEVEIVL